jgi:hemolysin III
MRITEIVLNLREPASAITHGLWFLLALPLLYRLRKQAGDPVKKCSVTVYGTTLLCCAAGSTVFHAVQGTPADIEWYNRLDHMGIGLLIAGTFTPIGVHLLEETTGRRTLMLIWLAALSAAVLRMTVEHIPKPIATSIYLAMGWSAIPGFFHLSRNVAWKETRMTAEGGLFYTIGALIHWRDSPDPLPGIFGAHDLFHVFVMLGSLRHFQFMKRVVLPASIDSALAIRLVKWRLLSDTDLVQGIGQPGIPKPYFWRVRQLNGRKQSNKL